MKMWVNQQNVLHQYFVGYIYGLITMETTAMIYPQICGLIFANQEKDGLS